MKWLKILGIITGVLIVILISVTIVVNNKITAAHGSGHSEGSIQGYEVSYEEGRKEGRAQGYEVGFREGSTAGYEKGKEKGYNSGYKTGFDERIGTDYLVRNPTYKEAEELLAQYKQDKEPISEPGQFDKSADLNNYAESKGIRTAYVSVSIPGGFHIPLVAFETIDKGLIFIEPQLDKEVKVEIGKRYSDLNGFSTPDYDDTITKITIIW